MPECIWCKYEKPEEEIQYILDAEHCVCRECFPEYADNEIAELSWKLGQVKALALQAKEQGACIKTLDEIINI